APVAARYVRYAFDDRTLLDGMHGWAVELEVFGIRAAASDPTITVVVDAAPTRRLNFRFTGTLGDFRLDDAVPDDGDPYENSRTFTVEAGTHTIREQLPNRWLLTMISCDSSMGSVVDLTTQRVTLTVAQGDHVRCTFVNQKENVVDVVLYHDQNRNRRNNNGEPRLSGWTVLLYDDTNNLLATALSNTAGRLQFSRLPAATYKVCEELPDEWMALHPSTIDATVNKPCYSLTLEAGQVARVRFGNGLIRHGPGLTPGGEGEDDGVVIEDEENSYDDNEGYENPGADDSEPSTYTLRIYLPLIAKD
ncbi:MAG: hypothetical protein KDE31_33105, partial [Caldilineaceae bacterium]|nr:hypothetical protein [Caldilineaceae bacterium]